MTKKNSSFLKSSFLLTITLLLCKCIAFIRAALLSRAMGVSIETDAFLASTTVISLFTTLLTYPVAQAFLPELAQYGEAEKVKREGFIDSVYTYIFLIGLGFTAFELLFSNQIVSLAMPGMNEEGRKLLRELLYIQFPCILTAVLGSVNRGMLNYKNRFSLAEMLTYLGTFSTVIYLVLFYHSASAKGLAIAFSLGSVVMSIVQFVIIRKDEYKLNFSFKVPPRFKIFLLSSVAFAIGGAVRDINTLCDKAIASLIGEGSVSLLSYANRLIVSEVSIISTAICMVTFVHIAKAWASKDLLAIKERIVNSAILINFAYFLVAALTIVCRTEIINIIYGGGHFTIDNINSATTAMLFYSIGLFGYGLHDLFVYSMNATQLVKYSVGTNICTVLLNVIGNFLLYKRMGINGVALASSCSMIVMNVPMFFICNRRIVSLLNSEMISETLKMLAAALGSIAVGMVTRNILSGIITSVVIRLIISSIIIVTVYLLILLLLRSGSTLKMIKLLRSRFLHKNSEV